LLYLGGAKALAHSLFELFKVLAKIAPTDDVVALEDRFPPSERRRRLLSGLPRSAVACGDRGIGR
jgi:hypothetical protein